HPVETRIALVQQFEMRLVLSGVLALLLAEQPRLPADSLVPDARHRFAHGAYKVAFEGRTDERDVVEQIPAVGIASVPLEGKIRLEPEVQPPHLDLCHRKLLLHTSQRQSPTDVSALRRSATSTRSPSGTSQCSGSRTASSPRSKVL